MCVCRRAEHLATVNHAFVMTIRRIHISEKVEKTVRTSTGELSAIGENETVRVLSYQVTAIGRSRITCPPAPMTEFIYCCARPFETILQIRFVFSAQIIRVERPDTERNSVNRSDDGHHCYRPYEIHVIDILSLWTRLCSVFFLSEIDRRQT